MARRHHILQNKGKITPDPFVKGKTDSIYFIADNDWIKHYDTWWDPINYDTPELKRGVYTEGTYKTQEVDEIWWMAQSVKFTHQKAKHSQDPTYLKNYDISQANLDALMDEEGVDYAKWLNMAGGYTYPVDGIAWWKKIYAIGDWHAYELRSFNKEQSTGELTTVAKEWDESELPDSLVGNNSNNPYFWFGYEDNHIKELQNPCVIKKIVCHFATSGELGLRLDYADGSHYAGNYTVVEGRNELDINLVVEKPVKRFSVSAYRGTIKAKKTKIQDEFGRIVYRTNQWWQGPTTHDWSLGIGLYVDTYQTYYNDTLCWNTPEIEDVMQLIGQAPTTSKDIFQRLIDFTVCNDSDNQLGRFPKTDYPLQGTLNTSGLTFFPAGSKENIDPKADYKDVFAAGKLFNMTVGHDCDHRGTMRVFNLIKGEVGGAKGIYFSPSVRNTGYPFGARQLRFSKRKTNGELGYKMYLDEENDQVLMLPYFANEQPVVEKSKLGNRLSDEGVWGNFHIGFGISFQAKVEGAKSVYIKQWINHDGRNIHFLDKDNKIIKTILHANPSNALTQVESRHQVPKNAVFVVWFTADPIEVYCDVEYEDYTKDPRYALPELPKGLLRGIVLRYTNRLYLKVCKPLSEMRLEEQEILSHIKMDN